MTETEFKDSFYIAVPSNFYRSNLSPSSDPLPRSRGLVTAFLSHNVVALPGCESASSLSICKAQNIPPSSCSTPTCPLPTHTPRNLTTETISALPLTQNPTRSRRTDTERNQHVRRLPHGAGVAVEDVAVEGTLERALSEGGDGCERERVRRCETMVTRGEAIWAGRGRHVIALS